MRNRKSSNPIKLALVFAVLAIAGLGWAARESSARQQAVPSTEPALKEARQVTVKLTDQVRGLLMKELEKGGFEGAADVCANVAQKITRDFNKKSGHYVRRISLGYRNPNDAPDAYEQKLLEDFDRQNGEKTLVAEHYEVVTEQGRQFLRYLKPIVAGKMCLNCHGQLDEILPRVRTILQRHYPDDKATGYREGDVRGAVSVKIALPNKLGK